MLNLPTDISGLKTLVAELIAELSAVKSELLLANSENSTLRLTIVDLQSQLGLNSRNSSKPPTSDGLSKPSAVARGKGGKVGGQKGHKGRTLRMVASESADSLQFHYPACCVHCGTSVAASECTLSERRQVFDLPPPKLFVSEHQVFGCTCGKCGHRSLAPFPKGLSAPVQYGSGAKAFASLLNQHYLLPFAKVSDLFDTLFGQPFNVSTLQSSNTALYAALETTEEGIKTAIINSQVAHFDETGLHINGKLNWLHVASTQEQTYYFAHAKRGTPALQDTLSVLPHFKGTAVHDCWSSYFTFDNCQHALCNAHLMRELQAALERGYTWAKTLQDQFKELLHLKQTDQLRSKLFKKYRKKIKNSLETIQKDLEQAADQSCKIAQKTKTLVKRLRQHLGKFLAFAKDQAIPFTNNLAERDIRMVKLKAKISGGFRTQEGAHSFARIKGVIATARKQEKNVFQILKNALEINDNQKVDLMSVS